MLGYLVLIGITAGVQGGPVTADDTEKQGMEVKETTPNSIDS